MHSPKAVCSACQERKSQLRACIPWQAMRTCMHAATAAAGSASGPAGAVLGSAGTVGRPCQAPPGSHACSGAALLHWPLHSQPTCSHPIQRPADQLLLLPLAGVQQHAAHSCMHPPLALRCCFLQAAWLPGSAPQQAGGCCPPACQQWQTWRASPALCRYRRTAHHLRWDVPGAAGARGSGACAPSPACAHMHRRHARHSACARCRATP